MAGWQWRGWDEDDSRRAKKTYLPESGGWVYEHRDPNGMYGHSFVPDINAWFAAVAAASAPMLGQLLGRLDRLTESVDRLRFSIRANSHILGEDIVANQELQARIEKLSSDVQALDTVEAGVVTVVTDLSASIVDLKAQLEAAGVSPEQLTAIDGLATTLEAQKQRLADAIAANTPAAPVPTPTPTPEPTPEPTPAPTPDPTPTPAPTDSGTDAGTGGDTGTTTPVTPPPAPADGTAPTDGTTPPASNA